MNDYKIIDEYGCDFDYSYLNKIIDKTLEMENVLSSNFAIVFIDDEKMHELNKNYRGIDRTTDVLSFIDGTNKSLGDVFISLNKALSQSTQYKHSLLREVAFLSVHGFLHLMGYDHQTKDEEEIMINKQKEILNKFKI